MRWPARIGLTLALTVVGTLFYGPHAYAATPVQHLRAAVERRADRDRAWWEHEHSTYRARISCHDAESGPVCSLNVRIDRVYRCRTVYVTARHAERLTVRPVNRYACGVTGTVG